MAFAPACSSSCSPPASPRPTGGNRLPVSNDLCIHLILLLAAHGDVEDFDVGAVFKIHTRCPSLPYSLSLSIILACLWVLSSAHTWSPLRCQFVLMFCFDTSHYLRLFLVPFVNYLTRCDVHAAEGGEVKGAWQLNWNFYYWRQLALVGSLFRHRCIWQALNDGINSYPSNACAYCRVSAKSLWLHCEFQLSDVETGNVLRTCVISSEIHFGVRIMRGYK